ncbi:MAG: N5-glutamine methyltransferase family protein, partial [Candidatus Zixiibacteriota bacterium]
TELLCENALMYFKYRIVSSSRTLYIGCGSGVIAVTVSLEMSHTDITAVDICEDALNVARENAHRLGAQGIVFAQSDLFAALPESERFDLILSNPPYIADGDYDGLPPEVKADPRLALTSGGQGLDLIKRLIAEAPDYLAPGGKLMFEIGYDQAEQIQKLVDHNESFVSSVLMKDLNDVDRVFILSV